MKKILLIAICICFSSYVFAQSDTSLLAYLKTKRYTQLTDTIHVDKAILPYYAAMIDFMSGDKAYLKDCYIPEAGVKEEEYFITISLYDIAGIKIKKTYDEEKPRVESGGGFGDKVIIIHDKPLLTINLSGKDGELIINKLSTKIIFKKY